MTRRSSSSPSRWTTSGRRPTCCARRTTQSDGQDGFVSFECTPDLADDTDGTVEQALELWRRLARPNVLIKVPATEAGIPAIEELTARGVNVNVTLLFSLARYEQVIEAYIAGLERRLEAGERVDSIASVASFFVSRVDAKADAQLPAGSDLRGRVAIANARSAYWRYRERFTDERWLILHDAGAKPQRPLWASTGTKDAAYSDVLYVDELVVPDAINTMPEATLHAFADHGRARRVLRLEPRRRRGDAPPRGGRGRRPRRHHDRARTRGCRVVLPVLRGAPGAHREQARGDRARGVRQPRRRPLVQRRRARLSGTGNARAGLTRLAGAAPLRRRRREIDRPPTAKSSSLRSAAASGCSAASAKPLQPSESSTTSRSCHARRRTRTPASRSANL